MPRRAGRLLFEINDQEARWRGWEITELRCGLARQYRDPRFDRPEERIVQDDSAGFVPGVPEAWDDHWDGGR